MKNKKGFTLVELIVFCAFMGFLVSIAVPQFKKYQQKNRDYEDSRKLSKNMMEEKTPSVIEKNNSDTIACIDGYKFVKSYPSPSQMIDDKGRGIKCSDN